MERLDKIIVCETDRGNYAVRPLNWAGCWDKDGKIKESGLNHIAVFHYKEDAEWYAETKNAEEQGLLLRLPCKVGGKVYVIAPNYNKCENHYECEEYDSERYLITWCQANCPKGFKGIGVVGNKVVEIKIREGDIYLQTDRCGLRNTKNMFLTKEEAEKALKQMGE